MHKRKYLENVDPFHKSLCYERVNINVRPGREYNINVTNIVQWILKSLIGI